ncbi:MAG TPA: hypothetical protein VLC09_09530 [Polyangiaceae bacterium]|nr:hypothetical protein [Polyangiaceae bacterium]
MKKWHAALAFVPLASAAIAPACSAPPAEDIGQDTPDAPSDDFSADDDLGDGDIDGDGGSENALGIRTGVVLTPECESDCPIFSNADGSAALVVTDEGVTDAEKSALDGATPKAGPCVAEPASGSMFPAGWTRPRFYYAGATGPHKITLRSANIRHELTVYAKQLPYVLPLEIWEGLSKSIYSTDIEYTLRAQDGAETTGTFQIAPAAAGGSMVFWGSTGTAAGEQTNALYGFSVGDEGVIRAIYPGDIQGTAITDNANLRKEFTTTEGHSTCVGCHSSTPDGKAVASMDHWPWNLRLYSIEGDSAGAPPDYLTGAGAGMLSMTWLGGTTFSGGDWDSGARRTITTWSERTADPWKTHDGSVLSNEPTELVAMNLASTASVPVDVSRVTPAEFSNQNQALQNALAGMKGTDWKVLERTGDANSPVLPDWSHDGSTIVYTSTDMPQDGRIGQATIVDLYTVPFNDAAGGAATPVEGAATADFEYYPDYSPDDALIAFNKVPQFTTSGGREDSWMHVYYRPDSDIHVIPAAGGTATRLVSNDSACDGASGQLYNSWAKWAPSVAKNDEVAYYFLIFSTARNSPFAINRGNARTSPASQLYVATIVRHADGRIESFPAVYLWNQRNLVEGTGDAATQVELLTNNVTPAWDEFKIPPVPPIAVN